MDASRTGIEAGPVLVSSCHCLHTTLAAPALGVVVRGSPCWPTGTRTGASAASSVRPASRPQGLLCGATDISVGDAGSVRWIAFLGRACRRHRQLLSTQGNGGVIRYLTSFSICLVATEWNPS